jgi:DHA3 family macrolide efflux protein-like MFS transporter
VLVALPLYVADDLGRSAGTLALYYTMFSVGSVIGALGAGYLRGLRLWPATIGIVIAFGVAMLPLGLDVPMPVALAAFAVAGLIWAPFPSISTALFQNSAVPADLPPILAARGAFTIVALPLGSGLAGPLIATMGARGTLLFCAVGTIVAGLLAAAFVGFGPMTRRSARVGVEL